MLSSKFETKDKL